MLSCFPTAGSAGADVLATSYTISQGIRKIGSYDLILCGKQTTDGDTAQVGAELAEFLGIPHLANVTKLMELVEGKKLDVEAEIPRMWWMSECCFPAC